MMNHHLQNLVVGTIFTLTLLGCKPLPPRPLLQNAHGAVIETPSPANNAEESKAQEIAMEAKKMQQGGDHHSAQARLKELAEKYPATEAGAMVLLEQARAAHAAGNITQAITLYERLLFYRPTFKDAIRARSTYSELLLKVGRYKDATPMLENLVGTVKDPEEKTRLEILLADTMGARGSARIALDSYIEALQKTNDAAQRENATHQAINNAGRLSLSEAKSLWNEMQGEEEWAFLEPYVAFRLAKIYYHSRDFDSAQELLQEIKENYAQSKFAIGAQALLERIEKRFKTAPKVIGVLLPLSGRYKQFGNRAKTAIEMAFENQSTYQLIFKDTQADAKKAALAVEELVMEQYALAIIGPLFSQESYSAALKAEELSVPIISLSHREGIPEIGPWVFRTALTVKAQATGLAQVAFEKLGMKNFAMLSPRSRYGKSFSNAFWDEVNQNSGEIRGFETYEHNATTFQNPIRRLVGRYFRSARTEYVDGVRAIRARQLSPQRTKTEIGRLVKKLNPVIDFDAIIIPDSGKNIGLIAPAIIFEDIVLTRDEADLETIRKTTQQKEIKTVVLLGASTWNSSLTLRSCEKYCENAIFVDAYFADRPAPHVQKFVGAFQERLSIQPRLSEAQAFDTAGWLLNVLQQTQPKQRNILRTALLEAEPYSGVSAKMQFTENGEIQKELFVLTIKDHTIREWQPQAPAAQEGAL
jgi:ABC-type branched-subunit amino acid transport system substrate-binding protein/predicted negative regulator of RcsB-dependent stress response